MGAHFQCNCQCHGWMIIDWIPGLIFFSFLRWLFQAFYILCYFMNLFFLDLSLNKRARPKSYHVLQPRCLPQERATSLRWHWDYLEAIKMAVYLLRLFYFLFFIFKLVGYYWSKFDLKIKIFFFSNNNN